MEMKMKCDQECGGGESETGKEREKEKEILFVFRWSIDLCSSSNQYLILGRETRDDRD